MATLDGVRVAVQGLGNVGIRLCHLLSKEGARLVVTDIDGARVERAVESFAAEAVGHEEIYSVDADVFAPCALGGVIRDETLSLLKVDIVAGAANNQLAEPRHAEALRRRGILYAPDYVGNAGGLISIYGELHCWEPNQALQKVRAIFETMKRVFKFACAQNVDPATAADRMAEAREAQIARSWV